MHWKELIDFLTDYGFQGKKVHFPKASDCSFNICANKVYWIWTKWPDGERHRAIVTASVNIIKCVPGTHRFAGHLLTLCHWALDFPVATDTSGAKAGLPLLTVSVHSPLPGARLWHTHTDKHRMSKQWKWESGNELTVQALFALTLVDLHWRTKCGR